jgi:hypothetical protein
MRNGDDMENKEMEDEGRTEEVVVGQRVKRGDIIKLDRLVSHCVYGSMLMFAAVAPSE